MSEWEIVTGLLADATERPAGERREWLRGSGHTEPVIAAALRLLETWEADPDFLEIELPPPAMVGPWRIGREIGAGGMGRVYEGFHIDPTLERRVAVKLIGGRRFAPELIESFLRERAILARLEHPGIARLYDTGTTPQGLPYFAMEYVEGLPIDRYVEENKPGERERIGLFLRVCEGVAFAHRNLIVHGDLKPSNILVTERGEPRLLDFGIGRMMQAGHAIPEPMLTPSHASPEQLEGQAITTASDIYQLGRLLRLLLGDARGELGHVIAKCIEADPGKRYRSAEALGEELSGWLRHFPVSAAPARAGYRAQKFVRRHPWGTALAAALVAGSVTTGWQARRAYLSEQQTRHQFEETRKFSRSMLRGLAGLPVATRKQMVEKTVTMLKTVEQPGERDPVVLLELAYAWRELGALQGLPTSANLGDAGASAESYAKAIGLAERARPLQERDSLEALTSYYAEAARVELVRKNQPGMDELSNKLAKAVGALEAYGPSPEVAMGYSELAHFRAQTNRGAAMDLYAKAIEQFNRAPKADLRQKAFALKRLGAILLAEKRLEEGVARYQAALAIEREIGSDPYSMSFTLSDLGLAERLQGRFSMAVAYYEEALAIREAAHKADPSDIRAVNGLASTLSYSSWVHADAGRPAEAVALSRRAVEMRVRAASGPSDSQFTRSKLAWERLHLAKFLWRQEAGRKAAEVERLLREVRRGLEKDPDGELAAELAKFPGSGD